VEIAPDLTECDRHCLTLLATQQRPISCYQLCKELESRGIGVWGIATVKRSLARLKRLGAVANSRKRPRGYYLPEKQSLFLRHLGEDDPEDDPKRRTVQAYTS
jgi:Fe2+ or Zn2+ uptake regulation protein